MIPAWAALGPWVFVVLSGGALVTSLGATLFSIHQQSSRNIFSIYQQSLWQHITPTQLLGRVTAAQRFLLFSFVPLGALGGGILGNQLGLRLTLLLGGGIASLSVLLLMISPVWNEKHSCKMKMKALYKRRTLVRQ